MLPRNDSSSVRIVVPPFTLEVEDCLVDILEVLKHEYPWGEKQFTVACKIRCGDVETKVFDLTVSDTRELKAKLLAEITKLKVMRMVYGDDYVRRVVG